MSISKDYINFALYLEQIKPAGKSIQSINLVSIQSCPCQAIILQKKGKLVEMHSQRLLDIINCVKSRGFGVAFIYLRTRILIVFYGLVGVWSV